jgi:hypothetical protein
VFLPEYGLIEKKWFLPYSFCKRSSVLLMPMPFLKGVTTEVPWSLITMVNLSSSCAAVILISL